MPKYNVDISYATTVEADNEMDAQEMAVDNHDSYSFNYCVVEVKGSVECYDELEEEESEDE